MYIEQGAVLYGDTFLSFNAHSLSHLTADVKRFGPLTENLAFDFESYNGLFKQLIRARKFPLTEFTKRYLERTSISFFSLGHEKKRPKQMHFIISTLKLCVTIETEDYFDPLVDVINCISFNNPEALCLYPIDSRIIGRYSCSINFIQIPIRKDYIYVGR